MINLIKDLTRLQADKATLLKENKKLQDAKPANVKELEAKVKQLQADLDGTAETTQAVINENNELKAKIAELEKTKK